MVENPVVARRLRCGISSQFGMICASRSEARTGTLLSASPLPEHRGRLDRGEGNVPGRSRRFSSPARRLRAPGRKPSTTPSRMFLRISGRDRIARVRGACAFHDRAVHGVGRMQEPEPAAEKGEPHRGRKLRKKAECDKLRGRQTIRPFRRAQRADGADQAPPPRPGPAEARRRPPRKGRRPKCPPRRSGRGRGCRRARGHRFAQAASVLLGWKSERPKPGRSGATMRKPEAQRGLMHEAEHEAASGHSMKGEDRAFRQGRRTPQSRVARPSGRRRTRSSPAAGIRRVDRPVAKTMMSLLPAVEYSNVAI